MGRLPARPSAVAVMIDVLKLARVAQFGRILVDFWVDSAGESATALSPGVVRVANPVVVRTYLLARRRIRVTL